MARWIAEREHAPLDRIVQAELRGRRYLNSAERRWVGDAVFGSVRFWRRQTLLLTARGYDEGPAGRIALWAEPGHGLDNSPAVLPERNSPSAYLRETLSFPDAMADELEESLGPEAVAAAEGFNRPAPNTFRVNTLRTSRSRALKRLPGATPTQYSPWGVQIAARANVHDLPGFRDGWFEIQDEASQLVALLTDARPGQTAADIGAGAGGKSLALAAMMGNEGRVLALDSSEERLARLKKRAERASARIIQPISVPADEHGRWQLSGTKQRTVDKLKLAADCVLVDAPCSGSGVLRRSPDAKWRVADEADFARLQVLLLEQSAALVSPGGCLVYAVCAFERAQGEDVVARFLDSEIGDSFMVTPAAPRLRQAIDRADLRSPEDGPTRSRSDVEGFASGDFLRTWPHRHNMDAFFAACFIHKR